MQDLTLADHPGLDPPELAAFLRHLSDVLRRKWRLIVTSTLLCVMIAALYLARTKPLYEATARLLLLQQGGRPLNVTKDEGTRILERSEDFIPTQMAILQSPRVVERAIETIGPENLPTLRAGSHAPSIQDLTRTMIKNYLKIKRPDRTASIIMVNCRAGSKREAIRVVEALVAGYEDYLINNYKHSNNKIVSIILKARDELSRELEVLEQKYLEFQQANPLLLADESGRSLINSRLAELDRAANESMVKAMKLRTQLEIGRKLAKEGADMWAVAHAMAQVSGDPGGNMIPRFAESLQGISADYLRQLIKEQQELAATYGPEYSKVKELQEQISLVQERARESVGRLGRGDTGQLLESIEQSLNSVEAMRAEIGKLRQSDMERAKRNAIDLTVGRNLQDRLERQKTVLFAIIDQLKQAQFGGDFGSISSQTMERANALDKPVHPQVLLTLLGSFLVGGILGVGAALTADQLDNRIHSLEDLRGITDLPVLGVIPRIAMNQLAATGGGGRISHMLTRSRLAEAYKVLRTNVEFLRRGRQVQVILITSSIAKEGKTITASNLAVSLAYAGRKALLVDADLRCPMLDKVFNLPCEVGLAHILKNMLPLNQAVKRTLIDNLDFISTGGEVVNSAELLMTARMREFVSEARQTYDFVIIDSSSLLAVTDPAIIGASADAIILVIRASHLKHHLLSRAMDLLQAVGTPVLGTVITGIDTHAFEHQYGHGAEEPEGSTRDNGTHRPSPPVELASVVSRLFAKPCE